MASTQDLWKSLHLRALGYSSGKDDPAWVSGKNDASWILVWSRKIPRFTKGCSCNEHWKKWYSKHPPDYSTMEKYFAWTVAAHNAVNERLNKATYTVEQAKDYYSKFLPAPKAPQVSASADTAK